MKISTVIKRLFHKHVYTIDDVAPTGARHGALMVYLKCTECGRTDNTFHDLTETERPIFRQPHIEDMLFRLGYLTKKKNGEVVFQHETRVSAYNNRGLAKSDRGDQQGAIEDFNNALHLNPKYEKAYLNRGLAKSRLNNFKGAIEDYTKAIRLNPKYALAYNNRGSVKSRIGDEKGAKADYLKADELEK